MVKEEKRMLGGGGELWKWRSRRAKKEEGG